MSNIGITAEWYLPEKENNIAEQKTHILKLNDSINS